MNPRFALQMFARNARVWTAACAMAAAVVGSPADGGAQTFTARIGNCTINDAVHEHIKLLKEEIEKQSNGRIKGELFINCQLGSIPRQIEGIQLGTQDFFSVPPGFAVGAVPGYQVADALGLFQDVSHAHRAITDPSFRDEYMKLGPDKGLIPVSLWVAGGANYIAVSPLRRLDDFKGKKFRVLATKLETGLVSSYGATGVPITFTEIVMSLQQRVIDGARTALLVMASAKMHSAAKYVTLIDDGFIPLITWASPRFMNQLPPDLRALVFKVGRELEPRMLPISLADYDHAVKELKGNGVEIITLPAADRAEMMRRAAATSEEYLSTNPTTKDLYPLLKKAADKTRGG